VNAISTIISVAQIAIIWFALRLLRSRSGEEGAKSLIAGTEAIAAGAKT